MVIAIAASRYDPSQFNKNHTAKTKQGALTVSEENRRQTVWPEYLPTWNPNQKFPPLKYFKYEDKGTLASENLSSLFPPGHSATVKKITPKFGTEVDGIQLSELSDQGKNDLALFIAQRGVVVFRNQNLTHQGPEAFAQFARHYGPLHVHPTSGAPESTPDLHITFRGTSQEELELAFKTRLNNIAWHTDVSYELQPPAYTFFSVLQGPVSGGDTLFADSVEAYNRLSPHMQQMLEGLHVLHTSEDQASLQRQQGGVARRDPVTNIHPLVRQHPATGKKYLFFNREFSRKIIELKEEESHALLEFLYNHVESAHDLQLRAVWEPNTIVCWDNRLTIHTATGIDELSTDEFGNPTIRLAVRASPQGERPVEHLSYLNDDTYLEEQYIKNGWKLYK